MMFDAQVTAVGFDVITPNPDADGNMPEGSVTLAVALAMLLPTGQGMVPMQAGVIRMAIPPNHARDLAAQLIEAAGKMPEPSEPSGLVVASPSDMANVAKQADAVSDLKGKAPRKKK